MSEPLTPVERFAALVLAAISAHNGPSLRKAAEECGLVISRITTIEATRQGTRLLERLETERIEAEIASLRERLATLKAAREARR